MIIILANRGALRKIAKVKKSEAVEADRLFDNIFDMNFQQELKAVEQEIKALENSDEYTTLAKKNRAWAVPKPTETEKGEWGLLKEKLAELKERRRDYVQIILSTNAHKADSTRNKYKTRPSRMRDCCCRMWRSRCGNDLASSLNVQGS